MWNLWTLTFQVPRTRREILETLFIGREILETLFIGLHRLEYRESDSAGIAIDSDDAGEADFDASFFGRKGLACIDVNVDAAAADPGSLRERASRAKKEQ